MKTKHTLLLTAALFALFHPLLSLAQQTGSQQAPQDWYGSCQMMGWHGMGFWWIFPLFMFILIVACFAMFFSRHHFAGGWSHHGGPWHMLDRQSGPGRSPSDATFTAMQILNERFAKGEIPKQEYEEKMAAILSAG